LGSDRRAWIILAFETQVIFITIGGEDTNQYKRKTDPMELPSLGGDTDKKSTRGEVTPELDLIGTA